jgi:hypothetical protein
MDSRENNEKDIQMDDIEIEHVDEKNIDYANMKEIYKQRNNERFYKADYVRNDEIINHNSESISPPKKSLQESNNEITEHFEQIQKFKVPPSLKKTFICSMVLFIIGITLIILGCIQEVAEADPGKGITFWVLGSIILIPGGYYTYQFYKARKARTYDERQEILDEIPEL